MHDAHLTHACTDLGVFRGLCSCHRQFTKNGCCTELLPDARDSKRCLSPERIRGPADGELAVCECPGVHLSK